MFIILYKFVVVKQIRKICDFSLEHDVFLYEYSLFRSGVHRAPFKHYCPNAEKFEKSVSKSKVFSKF